MQNYLNPAIEITKKAGQLLLKDYHKISDRDIYFKAHREFVTKTDLKSSKLIVDFLQKKFPKHNIISEEGVNIDKKSDFTWLIDPLDGTTNYIMQNPLFAVSISLVRANEILLGVIYAPVLNELYIAEKDKPAILNDKSLHVSKKDAIKDSMLLFCSGHKRMHKEKLIEIYKTFKLRAKALRQLGSASIELAYVASGRVEGLMLPGVPAWDITAGVLLVQQAGGKITDFKGNPWTTRTRDILATNSQIHEDMVGAMKENNL